jgi:hypothetical protein
MWKLARSGTANLSYAFTPEQMCLQQLARATWERRGQAKWIGLGYGEETATQTFLLDLAKTYPGNVIIVPFTKPIEGKNGADWAWSFESADGAYSFPMMVQAKVLDDFDQNYPELLHMVGKAREVRQIDRLRAAADELGFPAYYAFYNHLSDLSRVPSRCNSLGLVSPTPMPDSWGIAIASADDVEAALNDVSFDRHRLHSRPLHCLLCSGGTGARGPFGSPGRAASWFRDVEPAGTPLPPYGEPDLPPGVRRGSDPLFSAVRDYAGIDPERRRGLVEQLREKYPSVDGVVILRDAKAVRV